LFFVKNLENVQGDERDTILFSICYGPDRTGRVAMSFGPLNKRGGERRLNVAITRARKQLRVFSTLRHDQIQLSRTKSVGVQHLRTFLDFASRGIVALDEALSLAPGADVESPFEEEVLAAIQDLGWTAVPQVGCSGYRIDLAVQDPDNPGRFVLAVECDGATYHSTASARARDRQRQEVLESLGWRFHRIWSTDWWQSRAGEVRRLKAALESALQKLRAQDKEATAVAVPTVPALPTALPPAKLSPPAPIPAAPAPSPAPPPAPAFTLPNHLSGTPPADLSETRLCVQALGELVSAAAPVTTDTAARWLVDQTRQGAGRIGRRMRDQFETAVQHAQHQGVLALHGAVLWRPGQRETWSEWRLRGPRKADEVPAEEVRNLARSVLQSALAIERDELERAVATRLGFSRMGKRVAAAMAAGVDLLVAEGGADVEGTGLRWPG
jgi:very-short-patch-repair endonuclease